MGRNGLDDAAFWVESQDLLGCRVDAVSDNGLQPGIRDRVLKEAMRLWEVTETV